MRWVSYSQPGTIIGPPVTHERTAVKGAVHRTIAPVNRRVVELLVRVRFRDQHACGVQPQSAGYDTIRTNEETRPTALPGRGVGTADPHVVVRCFGDHRFGHGDARDGRSRVEGSSAITYGLSHGLETLGRDVGGMVRVEHELDAPAFVFAVQFRIPVIVANQRAAPDPLDREDAEVVPWSVVG